MLFSLGKILAGQRVRRRSFLHRDRARYSTPDIAASVTWPESSLSGQIDRKELSVKFHVCLHNEGYCYLWVLESQHFAVTFLSDDSNYIPNWVLQ